jgi:hypothetical protein
MKRIAIELNSDGIPSPQPCEGRSRSWAQSSIRYILLNERYRGIVVWGKTKNVLSPENREANLSVSPGWRMAAWRGTGATHRFGRALESHARAIEIRARGLRCQEGKRRGRAAASPYSSLDYSSAPNVAAASRLFQGFPQPLRFAVRMFHACPAWQLCWQKCATRSPP